jgi:hypothetical protein
MIAYVVAGPRRHEAERGTSRRRGGTHLKTAQANVVAIGS